MPRLPVEPLDPDLRVRPTAPTGLAAAGAAALLLTTTGDGLLAALLIGLAAADVVVGGVAVAAVLGTLARFGSTSLAGIAGAQAVLGPAVAVDPAVGALGSALLALSCLAAATPGRSVSVQPQTLRADGHGMIAAAVGAVAAAVRARPAIVPLGLLAGVVALGPSATAGLGDAAVRLVGAVVGVAAALLVARRLTVPWWTPPTLAAAGLILAVAA